MLKVVGKWDFDMNCSLDNLLADWRDLIQLIVHYYNATAMMAVATQP